MLDYKIANTAYEREAAFRLVYRNYLRQGLGEPNESEMRVTPFHFLETTTIFVAKLQEEVVATLTLVADGELGVPLETMFVGQVARLRERGVQFGEISCLADRRRSPSRFLSTFTKLTQLMAQFAQRRQIDTLLAAVHPRHARFYERYLGFRRLSGLAACPHVLGQPAVGMMLSFAEAATDNRVIYDRYFAEGMPSDRFVTSPMSDEEQARYRRVLPANGSCQRIAVSPQQPSALAS